MPYAQVSDVQALAPYVVLTRESQPSAGVVQIWIEDVEIILNSILTSMGYTTPIVSDVAIRSLKMAVANAVMAMVMRARPNPESDPALFQREYDAFLKRLRDDPYFDLEGAEQPGDKINKESPVKVSSNLSDLLDEGLTITRRQVF